MADGSKGTTQVEFAHGFDAALQVLSDFPTAKQIAVYFIRKGGSHE